MIAISLSPNAQSDDVLLAARMLFSPWRWSRGDGVSTLEEWFKRYFQIDYAIAFDSGRSAEYEILQAIGVGAGDEVLLQGFTCVAVPNSVRWVAGVPIYVDVDESGNLDIADAQKKLTSKTKAIIVQHTLGVAANMEKIKKFARENKLILIEDCAHALGASFKEKKLGTFGDIAFFSFGRDKVVSSVFGGMVITKNKIFAKELKNRQRSLSFPTFYWTIQQLFHPIAFALIIPLYPWVIGKGILFILQRLKLLSFPVAEMEKQGEKPLYYPRRLPNALASLALNQVRKLTMFNEHRRAIAGEYYKALISLPCVLPLQKPGDIYLRFNIQVEDPKEIYEFARRRGIFLGLWYAHMIDPKGVVFDKIGYKEGSCPKAEKLAKKSLNLPTYPRMNLQEAKKVTKVLETYFEKKKTI